MCGKRTTKGCLTCGKPDPKKPGAKIPVPVCYRLPRKDSIYYNRWKTPCVDILHSVAGESRIKELVERRRRIAHEAWKEANQDKEAVAKRKQEVERRTGSKRQAPKANMVKKRRTQKSE